MFDYKLPSNLVLGYDYHRSRGASDARFPVSNYVRPYIREGNDPL
jgi:hypothetical protein